MKCNDCWRRASIVIKTKHEKILFDMYLCNGHSRKEIVYLNHKYKSKEGTK